jgi:hypothetical protein
MRDVMIKAVAAGSTLTLVSQLHEHYNIDNEELDDGVTSSGQYGELMLVVNTSDHVRMVC